MFPFEDTDSHKYGWLATTETVYRIDFFSCAKADWNDDLYNKINLLLKSYNIDAIDIYNDDINTMRQIKDILFSSIFESDEGPNVILNYYINSTIRSYLQNSALKNRLIELNAIKKESDSEYEYSDINLDSVDFFFNYINKKLFDSYDLIFGD